MSLVVVASKNPVKIKAVELGFQKIFPKDKFEYQGIAVPSGVADQPMTNQETLKGAYNRANNAKKESPEADYWVGVEGGIEVVEEYMQAFAWVVVMSKERIGKAQTGVFILPAKVSELVQQGIELGEADDIVFGDTNSKQKNGAVGLLTNDATNRTEYYSEAVVLALIPFINESLYT